LVPGWTFNEYRHIANAFTLCVTLTYHPKMQTEIEANKSDHYLLCNYRFSDEAIETVKADVISFMSNREKDEDYFRFINWQKTERELVVLTMYAYDDIQLPKKFDIVFQIENSDNFIQVDFTITQAIINGWTPLNQISRGHRHICVIEFYYDIPAIFQSVPLFDKTLQSGVQLGFCDKTNFENIKANLLQTQNEAGERTT
jgi:hypothetical protein